MNTRKTDTILLSIHPSHVENILRGVKRFELRRRVPTDVKRIVIYATAPEARIAAVADIEEILSDSPSILWGKVCGAAGITYDFYQNYFRDIQMAFALRIGRIHSLAKNIVLTHSRLRLYPPQSFCYLDEKRTNWLMNCTEPMLLSGAKKIFVGGVHASGKGFLCEQVISSYGYHCVSASTLIKMGDGEVTLDKTVSNIDDNQRRLLLGLRKVQHGNTHLSIDGHFCLIDKRGLVRRIPFETFEAIKPDLIIIANPTADVVRERLKKCETPLYLKGSLENFIEKERRYARQVAEKLAVRLELIDTGMNKKELHKKVASIILGNQRH